MNAGVRLLHAGLTEKVLGVFYDVYNELGHGFLESVYEEAMSIALRQAGLRVDRQLPLKDMFRDFLVGDFRADVVVDRAVLLELKAATGLDPAHEAQLLNYLRATEIEVGLLLNFGPKPQFKRMVFENSKKGSRGSTRINADRK
ncbi:MAG TPA: GxxExxY protein [Candidatus Acidoferrales bacterium]|nr:GxxExxY protein [Candidatus Acidoferrales bacterium]